MRENKINKAQARQLLKGNFLPLLIGMSMVLLCCLAVVCAMEASGYLFDIYDSDGNVTEGKEWIYYILVFGMMTVLCFASPLFNGLLKMFANLTVKRKTDVAEMFCYFRSARVYFKTLLVNVVVYLSFSITSGLTDIYNTASTLTQKDITTEGESVLFYVLFAAAFVFSEITKILFYMIFVHYQLFGYAVDDSRGVIESTLGTVPFALKNFGKLFTLIVSFIGWFALCFFVVPAMYVAPYFATASANSVKWLRTPRFDY